ncbi:heterokaryon incompatibility protein-domain-containing protein [Exophiala viscosa]|uniref:Heterokaryon incompatibility protein-domain-containing protein n=1 Tax=Exophiala viscosa TaxID=2486360 RepID=A0AAN6I981_9EURO|nr:heterokaryon incompatibility protein-domain-containing protein [Exophiala viscosa]
MSLNTLVLVKTLLKHFQPRRFLHPFHVAIDFLNSALPNAVHFAARHCSWRQCARYEYRLLESPEHIRVLELLPADSQDDRIKCRLHHTTVANPIHEFTAISYAWGPPHARKELIDCDGCYAHIPPTLFSALKRLRSLTDRSQYLWADAICINQEGTRIALTEKEVQVRMMDRIFAKAKEVIVDLQPLREPKSNVLRHCGWDQLSTRPILTAAKEVVANLDQADDTDIRVLTYLDQYQAVSDDRWSAALASSNLTELFVSLKQYHLPRDNSAFWTIFPAFLCRPWFRRIWVLQEYALAQKVRFMIGTHFRDEHFLRKAVLRAVYHLNALYIYNRTYPSEDGLIPQLEKALGNIATPSQAIEQLNSIREQKSAGHNLCELLRSTNALFKATDIRDKAYALIGLCSDENIKEKFEIRYNEKPSRLMIRVHQYLSRCGFGDYALYSCIGDRSGYISWARNFENDAGDMLSQLVQPNGRTHPPVFQACAETKFICKLSDQRAGALIVRGYVIDVLDSCMGTALPKIDYSTSSELKDIERWLQSVSKWIRSRVPMLGSLVGPDIITSPDDLRLQSVWLDRAFEWMLSVVHKQPILEHEFINSCWRTLVADLVTGTGQEGQGITRLRNWPHSDRCVVHFAECQYLNYKKRMGEIPKDFWLDSSPERFTDARIFGESLKYAFGRKLGLSRDKKLPCLIPADARVGDEIVVVQGCPIPFVLRRKDDKDGKGDYFRVMGCVYVHGMMDGEAIGDGSNCRDIEIW